jgi:hypothetical protein
MSRVAEISGDRPLTRVARQAIGGAALIAAFAMLALFNSGGYRYGASDQAFYVPAVMRGVNPALFPRDRTLLGAQDHFTLVDELLGRVASATGASIPYVLFAAYLVMLLAVAGAGWVFGRAILATPWGAAALVLAMSIRHRVPKTGVNTLEHYFHPRMIAFAFGAAGLAALVRQRTWTAVALAVGAGVVHPTTGIWFSIVIGAGALVVGRDQRPRLLVIAGVGASIAVAALTVGGFASRLVVMDSEWLASLATKDYLFPDQWSIATWLQHALYVVVVAVSFRARRRLGLAGRGEHALAAGLAVVLLAVIATLPFVSARIALAVQLQVSRAMWVFDLVAVAYAIWWLVEAPWGARRSVVARRWAVALVACCALARGSYVMFVEKAGNPPIRVELPRDAWLDAMDWLRARPVDVHVLADPGHAWRYGSSVRIAAARDVFLEEVKDAAIGMYSRDMAMRVLTRTRAVDDFTRLTAARARTLAREYDLDYLVTEASLDLPIAYRNATFHVYALK